MRVCYRRCHIVSIVYLFSLFSFNLPHICISKPLNLSRRIYRRRLGAVNQWSLTTACTLKSKQTTKIWHCTWILTNFFNSQAPYKPKISLLVEQIYKNISALDRQQVRIVFDTCYAVHLHNIKLTDLTDLSSPIRPCFFKGTFPKDWPNSKLMLIRPLRQAKEDHFNSKSWLCQVHSLIYGNLFRSR